MNTRARANAELQPMTIGDAIKQMRDNNTLPADTQQQLIAARKIAAAHNLFLAIQRRSK